MKKQAVKLVALLLTMAMILCACGNLKSPTTSANTTEGASKTEPAAKAEYEIKLAHSAETNHPWHLAMLKFTEQVTKETNGRVKFNIFTAGEMGGEREMAEALQNGTLDMIIIATMGMSTFEPQVQIFDFPYLFPTFEKAYEVLDGEVGQMVADRLDKKGFHVLSYLENDYRGFSNSKHPINTPEDLKGLKLRVPESPVLVAWMKAVGAAPTPMPFNEVYSALQTGVVDGQDNGILLTYTHKLQEVQKCYSLTNHIYCPSPLFINSDLWKSMPADIQEIMQKAAVEARDYQRNLNKEYRVKYEEELKAAGMEINELTDENLQKFVDSAYSVYPQFTDLIDKDIYDAMMKAVK